MSIIENVKRDLTIAMKSGDKPRTGALRLILSELQKAVKDGGGDEVAVLRRERKRRVESAETYEQAGRADLADAERYEAELIGGYLPAELSDEQLDALVATAIAQTGAGSMKDMGQVMKHVMAAAAGQADGKRVSARVRAQLA